MIFVFSPKYRMGTLLLYNRGEWARRKNMDLKTFRRLGIAAVIVAATSAITPVDVSASAQRGKVPGKPKIVVVDSSSARKKNHLNIRVRIELPKSTRKLPITGSEVRLGNRTCKISKRKSTCVIKNVQMTPMIQRVQVRSKNKNGFGKYSSGVQVMTSGQTRWIRTGYTLVGNKLPLPTYAISDLKLLANSNDQKWNKLEALSRGGVRSLNRPLVSSMSQPTITFRTDGVVGLASADGSKTGTSGLYAVRSDGSAIDAVRSGSADIQDFYIAPNSRYYVVFKSPIALVENGPVCVLAEVDADTGNPRCVDYKLANVTNAGYSLVRNSNNNAIQFDDAGNIYYMGFLYSSDDSCTPSSSVATWCERSWRPTLRKAVGGNVKSLISDFVDNFNFVVVGDGSVVLTGSTNSTGANWTRRISATDSVMNIDATTRASFLQRFADGNIYYGVSGATGSGIRRMLTSTATVDPKWWISSQFSGSGSQVDSHFPPNALCSGAFTFGYSPVCAGYDLRFVMNFGTSQTLAISSSMMGKAQLVQMYPSPQLVTTSLTSLTVAEKVGDLVALAGTTESGVNSLVLFNPTTFQETVLMDQSNQVEIYSLAFVSSTRKLMFNGLDFATNRYVMGEVAIP